MFQVRLTHETVFCQQFFMAASEGCEQTKYHVQNGQAPQHSRRQASLQHAESNHCSIDQQFGLAPTREHLLTWLPALFEILQPWSSSLALDLHFAVNWFPDYSSDPGEQIICFVFVMASSMWKLRYFSSHF